MKNQTLFHKYELPLFFLLAYVLSWWTVPFLKGGLFPYGPSIAAVIVIATTAGRQGLREFWAHLTNWRAGWWYLVGPGIIVGYLFAAFVVNLWLGATITNPPHLPSAGTLLTLLLIGGVWEEPGWTGYAFPRLESYFADRKYPTLQASLVLGFLWSIWHLPLFLYGTLPWYDILIFVPAVRVIFSWLYHQSNGSVPAIMVSHYASNVLTGYTMLQVFTGSERTNYYVLLVAFACLAAFIVLLKDGLSLGQASKGDKL